MELTEFERLTLINQFKILQALSNDDDEKRDYEDNTEILVNGYEFHYNDFGYLATGEHTMTKAESQEVLDVLSMFEKIDWAIQDGVDTSGIENHHLTFAGFDGNHESKQLGYASFFCSPHKERFVGVVAGRNDLNSHAPLFPLYKLMVQEWKNSADENRLTRDDLIRITNVSMN